MQSSILTIVCLPVWVRAAFICLTTAVLLSPVSLLAIETNNFTWARPLTSFKKEDSFRASVMDAGGNVFAAYRHIDQPDPLPTRSNLVLKVSPSGEVLWHHRLLPGVRALVVTSSNILVAGSIADASIPTSLAVPSSYFSSKGISTEGTGGAYIARLSPESGVVESVKLLGTSLYVLPFGMVATPEGGLVIWGYYSRGSAQFGGISLPATSPSTARNLFLVKLDANGETVWAQTFVNADPSFGNPRGLAVDPAGNVICSAVSGTYSYAGGQIDGNHSQFAVKFDPDGKCLWSRPGVPGTGVIITDAEGNIYFPEGFEKLSPDGQSLWKAPPARKAVIDSKGNIFATGTFTTQFDSAGNADRELGSLKLGSFSLNTIAETEIYIVKYAPSGLVKWAAQTRGLEAAFRPRDFRYYPVSISAPDQIYLHPDGGIFLGGTVRGRVLLGDTELTGAHNQDFSPPPTFFVARLSDHSTNRAFLRIETVSDDAVRLLWLRASDHVLESSEGLLSTNWVPVDQVPAVSGDQYSVRVHTGGRRKYFRLREQF